MPSRPHLRWAAAAAIAAALGVGAGGAAWVRSVLPEGDALARGLSVGGVATVEGETATAAAEARARALLGRRFTLRHAGEVALETSLEELGATVDTQAVARRARSVGRDGDLIARLDAALEARAGRVDVPVRVELPVEALAERLDRFKEERDVRPTPARLDVATRTATAHRSGRYLDVYASAAAIDAAVAPGRDPGSRSPGPGRDDRAAGDLELPALEVLPRASTEVVAAIDTSRVLSTFSTRYGWLGGERGRAQNIARAASQMEGVVLMPGEIVSFNENVGPRSLENGFALAPEIYKGEMREGVGGGTCQVSGTLHAAAFFGGVDVVERSNHSRPSGYIRPGLDATVVYPVVDLKLRNPFDFPVVIHSTAEKGVLTFELYGKDRPATVELATATVGVAAYKRKIEEAPWLAEGTVKLKQKGIRGLSIRKTRVIHLTGGAERVEVSTDVYPPTFEIYLVPPGTDVATALPPLPDDRTAANDAVTAEGAPAEPR